MKFGKQIKRLADPAHLNHYLAYDVLKKAINVVFTNPQIPEDGPDVKADVEAVSAAFGQTTHALEANSCRPPDSRFHELLQHELAKVNRFAALQIRTLVDALQEASRVLLVECGQGPGLDAEALSAVERQLDDAAADLVKLENFRRLNFTGFRKIVKKFDKRSIEVSTVSGTFMAWFVPQLLREFFVSATLDPLMLALAWGYSALRRHRRGNVETPALRPAVTAPSLPAQQWDAPAKTSTTSVSWLAPNARMRVLCTLMKRFELVLPPTGEVADGAAADIMATLEQQRRLLLSMTPDNLVRMPRLATEVSLVYYDTPAFPGYKQRLQQPGGAGPAGFRCRRAKYSSGQDQRAYSELVERDGAASALGPSAFAQVGALQMENAFPFSGSHEGGAGADGPAALREAASAVLAAGGRCAGFANEVAKAAAAEDLVPMATVGSARLLLRGDTEGTRGVSIALDEDVQFSRGPTGPAVTAPSDAVDFPYCLFEVAHDSTDGADDSWLDEVRGFAAIRSIDGFSTGAHAVAALHRDDVPELPHWFEHLATVEGHAPPEAWSLTLEWRAAWEDAKKETATERMRGISEGDDGHRLSPLPPLGEAASAAPPATPMKRIEPKNFLASERTMLEWMHTVIASVLLGLGLWRVSLSGVGEHQNASPPHRKFGVLNAGDLASFALGVYSLALVSIGLLFAWYAAFAHIRRSNALFKDKHTERVFNTRFGPTAFAVFVGCALTLHLVVQVAPLIKDIFNGELGVRSTQDGSTAYTLPATLAAV